MKKIIGLLLTLSVSIGILLFSADSVIAASYNSSAALNYAAAHWNDNVGLCAEFVSNCLSAGRLQCMEQEQQRFKKSADKFRTWNRV